MCKLNPDKHAEDVKQPYSISKDVVRILLVIAVPLAFIATTLERFKIISIYENGDFTNAFGFFIEVGVALFISVLLFRYSKAQQDKAVEVLKTVSDTTSRLKSISDSLEQNRTQRQQVVLNALTNSIMGIWMTAQSALFVTCKNGFKESDKEDKFSAFVLANLRDYKRGVAGGLAHLDSLMLLGSEVLDPKLVSGLFDLRGSIQFCVLTESFIGRAAHPWSGSLNAINQFAKDHMRSLLPRLILLPEIDGFLPEDIRKELKKK